MSSYLNFYLVPKKEEKEAKPKLFLSYSRSSPIYQAFYENANPTFIGLEEPKYTELGKKLIRNVIDAIKEDIKKAETVLQEKTEALRELAPLDKETVDEYISDRISSKEYIDEMKELLSGLEIIADIVCDLEYSDFEKVLINID